MKALLSEPRQTINSSYHRQFDEEMKLDIDISIHFMGMTTIIVNIMKDHHRYYSGGGKRLPSSSI